MAKTAPGASPTFQKLFDEQRERNGIDIITLNPTTKPISIYKRDDDDELDSKVNASLKSKPTNNERPSIVRQNARSNLNGMSGKTRRRNVIYIRKSKKSTRKSKHVKTLSKRNLHSRNTRKHINVLR